MNLLAELNLPNTDSIRNTIKELEEKHSEKEIVEAFEIAQLSGRGDLPYIIALLKIPLKQGD